MPLEDSLGWGLFFGIASLSPAEIYVFVLSKMAESEPTGNRRNRFSRNRERERKCFSGTGTLLEQYRAECTLEGFPSQ